MIFFRRKILLIPLFAVIAAGFYLSVSRGESKIIKNTPSATPVAVLNTQRSADFNFIGPRMGIPPDSPGEYGFWSFAVVDPGILSRSGQPLISEFTWLKSKGWKSVVDLRVDGERGEIGDDNKLSGFKKLGFNYLYMPIADGSPPNENQARLFLSFVTNEANQPVHVHCRGGIGRTGTMVALYRYAVQGWPMDRAISESRAFDGGVSLTQKIWLEAWARDHKPGEI